MSHSTKGWKGVNWISQETTLRYVHSEVVQLSREKFAQDSAGGTSSVDQDVEPTKSGYIALNPDGVSTTSWIPTIIPG